MREGEDATSSVLLRAQGYIRVALYANAHRLTPSLQRESIPKCIRNNTMDSRFFFSHEMNLCDVGYLYRLLRLSRYTHKKE